MIGGDDDTLGLGPAAPATVVAWGDVGTFDEASPAGAPDDRVGWRELAVRHETRYRYDTPVEVAHHSGHLRPRPTPTQRVLQWMLAVDPPPDGRVQASQDAFGNWRHGFSHAMVHDALEVVSTARVQVAQAPLPDLASSTPWEQVAAALQYRSGLQQPDAVAFMLASLHAPHDVALAAYAADLFPPGVPVLLGAQALMSRIHGGLRYAPHTTDVWTTAPQALALGHGVCQDFAHVMIGALRSLGLAARYVSGYLLTHPLPGQPRLVGADASHAWVQVWCPRLGWIAFDPTNDVVVQCDHVTLAWGRDYEDVAPLRGIVRGGGGAPPHVGVTVTPIEMRASGS